MRLPIRNQEAEEKSASSKSMTSYYYEDQGVGRKGTAEVMARPRVFVSSTFYDLKNMRADVEAALAQLNYDSVLHERGNVPYDKSKRLEQDCYREINNCDIVVSIVGGRFGSTSSVDNQHSISQMELRTTVELDKQLFIFVDRPVLVEYGTWLRNQDVPVNWNYVDNIKIFEFLKFVQELPRNNPIQPFDTSTDVTSFLKEQFAGLFQRLLNDREVRQEYNLASQLRATSELLNKTVEKATNSASGKLPELIFANQRMFQQMRKVLSVPYRVFFTNFTEMSDWLKQRLYDFDDDFFSEHADYYAFTRNDTATKSIYKLLIAKTCFDENNEVRYIPSSEWKKEYLSLTQTRSDTFDLDDEIPF